MRGYALAPHDTGQWVTSRAVRGSRILSVRFTPQLESYALSHQGRRRSNNEDAYLIDRQMGLYIVCDGMGGHAAGEVASSMAVESVHASLQKVFAKKPPLIETFEQRQMLRKTIAQTIFEAGQKIHQHGKNNAAQKGMGTTLTMCLFVEHKAFLGHVGDSRCYLLRNGRTHQLTEDHTFFNEVKKTSGIEAAQKALQRIPNALSRALGAQPAVQVDTLELDLLPGDRFLLCSDGLHGYLDDNKVDLHAFVQEHPFPDLPKQLVVYANQMGGKDNITVIGVQIGAQQENRNTQNMRTSMAALRHIQLFQQLDYKEHIQLFNMFQMREFKPGDMVIRQGEPGDALFVLTQGIVTVFRDNKPIARLEPGHHFGEMALIDNSPRSATIVADTPCLLLHISRDEFERLIQQKPNLGVKLMGNLLRSLAKIVRDQSQMLLKVAPEAEFIGIARSVPETNAEFLGTSEPFVPMPTDATPTKDNLDIVPDDPGTDPNHTWQDTAELMLPTETSEHKVPEMAKSMRVDPLQPVQPSRDPFAETAELNPFQPVELELDADPFSETAEFKAFDTKSPTRPRQPIRPPQSANSDKKGSK